MDSQELNKACELAFRVAREGVEQDPPIDPPPSMRMFLYVRQFPQRAITVARQALVEDTDFRARVAAEATEESVGAAALAWLNDADADSPTDTGAVGHSETDEGDANFSDTVDDGPVTSESIRSEMDELKSLVGQLNEEGAAVGSEVDGLAGRLEEAEEGTGLASALSTATAGASATSATSSLSGQVRSLHADLKQARSERDQAQEAKELAILEHAELAEELESLRTLAGSARVQLTDLEAKVDAVSSEKAQLETEKQALSEEKQALSDERQTLTTDKDSLSAEVAEAADKLAASEEKLAAAESNLNNLTAELESAKGSAGVSVDELQAAVSARAAMESHVDALGGAHAKAKAEMERVNTALGDKNASDSQKIETLKVALASVTAERDALQAKLEAVRATVSSLQGEMAKLDSNMTDAESVASVLNERMEELQTSVEGMPSDASIVGDLAQFETPDMPEIAAFVAPAAVAAVTIEAESIDEVADEVAETVSSFEDDEITDEAPADFDPSFDDVASDEDAASSEGLATEDQDDSNDDDSSDGHLGLDDHDAPLDDFASEEADASDQGSEVDEASGTDDMVDEAVPTMLEEDFDWLTADDSTADTAADVVGDRAIDYEVDSAVDAPEPHVDEEALSSWVSDSSDDELVPDEMIEPIDADDFIHNLEEAEPEEASVSPLVMSDTTDEVDVADAVAVDVHQFEAHEIAETEDVSQVEEIPETEDIDEVHALVAETVASFEPNESDDLPGATVPAEEVEEATPRKRGGLTSLFSSRRNEESAAATDAEIAASDMHEHTAVVEADDSDGGGLGKGLLATAGVGAIGAVAGLMGTADVASEQIVDNADVDAMPAAGSRGPIQVPGEIATDPLATARHIVNTENAVVLVDGDPVAAMGWPSVERVEQRRNLVHYLSVMAGSSGAAPDVLLDRDFGADRLPDSRSVRVRVTNEEGSVSAQIVSLIDTYPHDWPVVVVTDNMDLAAEAAMKGATLLDNGQLLDLFIAP